MKEKLLILGIAFVALTSCQQAKYKALELAAEQTNRECPMIIDEVTQLDSTAYSAATNTFSYYYTLTGVADDPNAIETMKSELEQTLPETVKQIEELKIFRETNVTMDYVYLSNKTKEKLIQVSVTADQYK